MVRSLEFSQMLDLTGGLHRVGIKGFGKKQTNHKLVRHLVLPQRRGV